MAKEISPPPIRMDYVHDRLWRSEVDPVFSRIVHPESLDLCDHTLI